MLNYLSLLYLFSCTSSTGNVSVGNLTQYLHNQTSSCNCLIIYLSYIYLFSCISTTTGNVSVGNLTQYLPFVLKEIETQPKRQYLLLHSLKEVTRALSSVWSFHPVLSCQNGCPRLEAIPRVSYKR